MIQKPEDRLRAWFRAAPLPDEPDSLHEFLAAVPRTHPRRMGGSLSLAVLWPRPALAGVAAVLLVAIVGGLLFGLSRGETVPAGSPSSVATATATALRSGSAPTGSIGPTSSAPTSTASLADGASPTPNTAWKVGLSALNLPVASTKTAGVSLPEFDSVTRQVWGSRYYVAGWTAVDDGLLPTSAATAILRYGDAATGKAASVPLPLTSAELSGLRNRRVGGGFSVAADGSHVAVVVWYLLAAYTDPIGIPCASNASSPISWRILVAPVDPSTGAPGAFAAIANGRNKVAFRPMGGEGCDTVSAPLVALSGDQIAYNIEAAAAGHPLASTILLHSLSGGAPDRQIPTDAMPVGLRVSGTNVAWLEADGNPPMPLRISTSAHPAPALVETLDTPGTAYAWSIPEFNLDGDQIEWQKYATNEVFAETIGGTATRISPSGVACLLGGSEPGQVLLMCYPGDPFLGNGDLVIWSAGAGLRLVAGYPAGANGVSWLSNGWVATEASGYPSSDVTFFRLSDLAG